MAQEHAEYRAVVQKTVGKATYLYISALEANGSLRKGDEGVFRLLRKAEIRSTPAPKSTAPSSIIENGGEGQLTTSENESSCKEKVALPPSPPREAQLIL